MMDRVKVLFHSPNPDRVAAVGAYTSFYRIGPSKINEIKSEEAVKKTLDKVIGYGHVSVMDHPTFTLAFEGVSRIFEWFLVEHRLAGFTVRSERYVDFSSSGYYLPSDIEKQEELKKLVESHYEKLFSAYKLLLDLGVPREDARFVLPMAVKTNILCTMNARELSHFIYAASKGRGSFVEEIKSLGEETFEKVRVIAPVLFSKLKWIERGKNEKAMEIKKLLGVGRVKRKPMDEVEVLLLDHTLELEEKVVKYASLIHAGVDSENKEIIDIILNNRRPRELEQVYFTFLVRGVSIATLIQFLRHRMQSPLVPFLDSVGENGYVVPESVMSSEKALEIFVDAMESSKELRENLRNEGLSEVIVSYSLNQGNKIEFISTIDGRELYHIFRLRTCQRAQWEVRKVALEMLKLVKKIAPNIFKKAGPSCVQWGYCPEGELMPEECRKVGIKKIQERFMKMGVEEDEEES